MNTLGTRWSVLYTVEALYCGHLGDWVKCPVERGVLISGVNLHSERHSKGGVLISGVSFKRVSIVLQ